MRLIARNFLLFLDLLAVVVLLGWSFPALAQAVVAVAPPQPVNFTAVAVSVVGTVFTVLGAIATAYINARMKDTKDAATMRAVVDNALGAMQQATVQGIQILNPQANIPGISPVLAVGLQYALDHAGTEFNRAGITPAAVADKIKARMGLANIATNLAVASNSTPVVPSPISPVPVTQAAPAAAPVVAPPVPAPVAPVAPPAV